MAWEERNGKRYYYRKVWAAGRAVSEYVGHGPSAERVAEYEALRRQQRRSQAAFERDQLAAVLSDVREPEALREYAGAVQRAVAQVLTDLGFHQLKRTWRRKRMSEITRADAGAAAFARARLLYQKKNRTPSELAEYKTLLSAHPALPRAFGDPARMVRLFPMEVLNKDPAVAVAVEARLHQIELDLGYATASELERLQIEVIVCCYLDFYSTQIVYGARMEKAYTLGEAERWERILHSKEGRYLRAIESLARVRRLLKLTIQINVATPGSQQVNVATNVQIPPGGQE